MSRGLEFGLVTFGDVTAGVEGRLVTHAQTIRQVVEEGVFADGLGVDFFGVGEHHREDLAISSPEMVLAAIASRTGQLRLGSAVTVLSADDPVRVYERFSTLNAIAQGRAEIILGRGWFTEAFELFGHDVADYDNLFQDKLKRFMAIRERGQALLEDKKTGRVYGRKVFPPIETEKLETWMAVGSTPASVLRAVNYRMPMIIASIGGHPTRFRPFVDLYVKAFEKVGDPPAAVGVQSSGFIGRTDSEAVSDYWACYKTQRDRFGAERGWAPLEDHQYIAEIESGSLYVGSPSTVAKKIAKTMIDLGASRFVMRYSCGTLSHEKMLESIELYATHVIPMVRDIVNRARGLDVGVGSGEAVHRAPVGG